MAGPPNILHRILESKRVEVEALKAGTDAAALRERAEAMPPCRDFLGALQSAPHAAIIAEIKRSSPSEGAIRTGLDVAAQAETYAAGGAAALSVLTDRPFFGGCLDDLARARAAAALPVLRKDFIVDPFQLYEARAAGADAVLLIAAALSSGQLVELYELAGDLGLAVLLEVHHEEELETVLNLDPPLVGINNRDLTTMAVSLDTSLKLRSLIPASTTVVAESGIHQPEDVARLRAGGLSAFLIGTSLMKSDDPGRLLKQLCRAGG